MMSLKKSGGALLCGVLLALPAAQGADAPAPAAAPAAAAALPTTISPQARELIAHLQPPPDGVPLEEQRKFADSYQAMFSAVQRKRYAVDISDASLAGVPVRVIAPKGGKKARFVLLNLHGGGFALDSGSLTENIPLAALTQATVYAVRYRLAPEHPFPAALDDGVAVYKELLRSHPARDIVVYGTSAGAVLTAELGARLKQLKLPMPAALGFFSGSADFARPGESELRLNPLIPMFSEAEVARVFGGYIGSTGRTDPILSPIYSDLHGWPPTLLITSTRDFLSSDTELFHRALLGAGVDARLVVFEALPHAFWSYTDLPESTEAFELMARFITAHAHH